jgi:hypothetical protein
LFGHFQYISVGLWCAFMPNMHLLFARKLFFFFSPPPPPPKISWVALCGLPVCVLVLVGLVCYHTDHKSRSGEVTSQTVVSGGVYCMYVCTQTVLLYCDSLIHWEVVEQQLTFLSMYVCVCACVCVCVCVCVWIGNVLKLHAEMPPLMRCVWIADFLNVLMGWLW